MFSFMLATMFAHNQDPITIARLRADFTRIVAHLDENHDGEVSKREWYDAPELAVPGAVAPLSASDKKEKRLLAIGDFKDEDTDHDGFVTVEELVRSRESIFHCLDANGDGSVTAAESAAAKCIPTHK